MKQLKRFEEDTTLLEVHDHTTLDKGIQTMTLLEIIEKIDQLHLSKGDSFDWVEYAKLRNVLAYRLGFLPHSYLQKDVTDSLNELVDKLNETIKAFSIHRHPLDKTYGARPTY